MLKCRWCIDTPRADWTCFSVKRMESPSQKHSIARGINAHTQFITDHKESIPLLKATVLTKYGRKERCKERVQWQKLGHKESIPLLKATVTTKCSNIWPYETGTTENEFGSHGSMENLSSHGYRERKEKTTM